MTHLKMQAEVVSPHAKDLCVVLHFDSLGDSHTLPGRYLFYLPVETHISLDQQQVWIIDNYLKRHRCGVVILIHTACSQRFGRKVRYHERDRKTL